MAHHHYFCRWGARVSRAAAYHEPEQAGEAVRAGHETRVAAVYRVTASHACLDTRAGACALLGQSHSNIYGA